MYKRIRKRKGEKLQDIKLAQSRCQNLSMSKIDYLCGRLAIFHYEKLYSLKPHYPETKILKRTHIQLLCNYPFKNTLY